ncbi:polyphosphate:AMP phosphotransferase [Roseospirillum parvum]|uniref:Polyphosphate:AMP phosphotransferase n=1 Tax=Roseospirillum parvum TaxID=83401 RepID=A0A1G8CV51_9PROT|nr:polyphosphate:AMP phosphotransferase [Roseospirillum parvum]SDH49336.1 polyphosphate:AMP phosphotransferase [Roseospirillum parvum]
MFRTAELGRQVPKADFDALADPLRIEMLELQQTLRQCPFPVVLVFAGVDGAGKGESMNLLNEWMDPRWIANHAYGPSSDEERERPEFWRYWRDLPANGQIGLFLSSWYSAPMLDHVHGRIDDAGFEARLGRIAAFEKCLADDGAMILKFWMHLGKKAQKQRLKSLEKDPEEAWRVTARDWANFEIYDQFIASAERLIMETSHGHAPWTLVEGVDPRYRALTVLTSLRDTARRHIKTQEARRRMTADLKKAAHQATPRSRRTQARESGRPEGDVLARQPSVLDALDMTQSVSKADYAQEFRHQRARLARLFRQWKARGRSVVLVFEGQDAAGKGGAIRRLTSALDARDRRVVPVAAPSDEEKAHHYLWRFWRHLSRAGRLTVFDRSWYGRVLVERVEGYATPEEWRRAFAEINEFEDQLVEHGTVLVKYWLHITQDEQLARFNARAEIPYKSWKLTEEDWRNREKWDLYEEAVTDMVEQTSTRRAPWTLIEGNSKRFARIKVIRTLADRLEDELAALSKAEKKADKKGDKNSG